MINMSQLVQGKSGDDGLVITFLCCRVIMKNIAGPERYSPGELYGGAYAGDEGGEGWDITLLLCVLHLQVIKSSTNQ